MLKNFKRSDCHVPDSKLYQLFGLPYKDTELKSFKQLARYIFYVVPEIKEVSVLDAQLNRITIYTHGFNLSTLSQNQILQFFPPPVAVVFDTSNPNDKDEKDFA